MRAPRLVIALAVALGVTALVPALAVASGSVTILSGPAEGERIAGPTASFTYSVEGIPTPEFFCSVDGGTAASCLPSGFTTPALSNGPHSFTLFARTAGGIDQTPPVTRNFIVGLAPLVAVVIGGDKVKANKKGRFGIPITCPASSPEACSGSASVTCCGGAGKATLHDITITSFPPKKIAAGVAAREPTKVTVPDIKFAIPAGQTAYLTGQLKYSAKAGKTGATKGRSAFAAKTKDIRKNITINLRTHQQRASGGGTSEPPIETSATVKVQPQKYTAKQGSSGKTK